MRWSIPGLKKTAKASGSDYNAQRERLLKKLQQINLDIEDARDHHTPGDSGIDSNSNVSESSQLIIEGTSSKERVVLIDTGATNHLSEKKEGKKETPAPSVPEKLIVENKINVLGCLEKIRSFFPKSAAPEFPHLILYGKSDRLTTGAERRIQRKKFWLLISICFLLILGILSMISKI